ncbi:hypothetical protein HRG_007551 [Hirsutella rhossiliensis]|uniref:Uncharacterized protein n=1 Tax=Hirsutella rhossiliensis TaxID=111463 RepID=A0A9P8SG06_9HYPO|nr:uncharacterized protein HRG_07551 [Hirsutella rhossiliensis]KAH0961473.1 hypothetical protein HRG_07551 [Hirsutella rhossiliensis]
MSHDADDGAKRAAEINEAMLGMPGYADDSLFFTVRYGERAKNTLRQCDWEEFQRTIDAITDLWIKAGGGGTQPEAGPPPDQRSARAAELRAHAISLIGDFPDLVRDFDRFTASCQAAMAAVTRSGLRK